MDGHENQYLQIPQAHDTPLHLQLARLIHGCQDGSAVPKPTTHDYALPLKTSCHPGSRGTCRTQPRACFRLIVNVPPGSSYPKCRASGFATLHTQPCPRYAATHDFRRHVKTGSIPKWPLLSLTATVGWAVSLEPKRHKQEAVLHYPGSMCSCFPFWKEFMETGSPRWSDTNSADGREE